jgi:hypothetical protein
MGGALQKVYNWVHFYNFVHIHFCMTRQANVDKTILAIQRLPYKKAQEVSNFAEFLAQKYEGLELVASMQQLMQESETFAFLNDEGELYTIDDLKEKYDG